MNIINMKPMNDTMHCEMKESEGYVPEEIIDGV